MNTRHPLFSASGLLTRALLLAVRITPEPTDALVAAAFGIVELLGARRLWKILGPAIKQQLKEQFGENPNKQARARAVAKDEKKP